MRWIKAIAAALAMLVVIGGAPVLLLSWGGLRVGWWRADDGSLFFTILTVAGWLAWLAFTVATVLEVVRFASGGRFIPNLPLLGGLQALCAGLVLTVVAVAASTTASLGEPAVTTAIPATTLDPVGTADAPAALADQAGPERPRAEPEARPSPVAGTAEAVGVSYTVVAGDDLWSIAERLFGEGRRWRELARANPDLLSEPTSQLPAGSRLRLPAGARAAAVELPNVPAGTTPDVAAGKSGKTSGSGKSAKPRTVTVKRGDTLSGLAEQYLGSAGRWPRIAAANADLISDPDHIEIGWELVIPQRQTGKAKQLRQEGPAGAAQDREVAGPDQAPASPTPPAQPAETSPAPTEAGPAPAETTEPADAEAQAPSAAATADLALIGSLSALAAAGLLGGWQARRLLRSRVRAPGRRLLHPDDPLQRLHAAVGRRQVTDHPVALDAALRAIGRHFHRVDLPLPDLAQVGLTAERISFNWATPAGPPPAGFEGDSTTWWLTLPPDGASLLGGPEHPCAFPALVSLGVAADGETVLIDLERSGVVGVAADHSELQLASLAAIAVELACAPWATELALTSVGAEGELARAAGGDAVTRLDDVEAALAQLRRQHAARRRALSGLDLRRLRTDPERADAVAPQIYVFHDRPTAAQRQELDALLTGSGLGFAAVLPVEFGSAAQWELFGDPLRPAGRFQGGELTAHAIPESTRAAVAAWYQVAEATETESAPWWSDEDAPNLRLLPSRHPPSEEPVDIVSLRRVVRPHPTLQLIGPIDLVGAAGPEPSRARYQLIELGSWLLENPGRTATEMATGLGIAESTRRSNLSRLRAWLGTDPHGEPYLPEAYSGRIQLHPQVSSDITQLHLLTGPGVNRIGEDGLVAALDLVRGGVLADAAPGQWYWAETLRSDVAATLRDAALVLVDRALYRDDLDLARWATERALLVAPEDELLLCARIRTEYAAGNRATVERHVLQLTQQARALGVDLLPQTVMLCQQVMEGRPRARRA